MSENTKIQWCDHTFNPWVGCAKVSPGCDHCYAESWSKRTGNANLWAGDRRRTSVANWRLPLKWNQRAEIEHHAWQEGLALFDVDEAECIARGYVKPRRPRVFCASLADVFDNQVPHEWRADLWELIAHTAYLDWLLLTTPSPPRALKRSVSLTVYSLPISPPLPRKKMDRTFMFCNVWDLFRASARVGSLKTLLRGELRTHRIIRKLRASP